MTNLQNNIVLGLEANELFVTSYLEGAGFLPSCLLFSFALFSIGLLGMIFNYKNFLITIMSVELMYLGIITSFVVLGVVSHDPRGAIYSLALLILAACESAIGLGILIVLYRFGRSIDFTAYQQIGG